MQALQHKSGQSSVCLETIVNIQRVLKIILVCIALGISILLLIFHISTLLTEIGSAYEGDQR